MRPTCSVYEVEAYTRVVFRFKEGKRGHAKKEAGPVVGVSIVLMGQVYHGGAEPAHDVRKVVEKILA